MLIPSSIPNIPLFFFLFFFFFERKSPIFILSLYYILNIFSRDKYLITIYMKCTGNLNYSLVHGVLPNSFYSSNFPSFSAIKPLNSKINLE